MCLFRQSDGWSVRCGVGAWPPPEEEAAQESDHVHSGAARGAWKGFRENPLPRHLHQGGAGPEDQTDWGQGPGNTLSIHPCVHLSVHTTTICPSIHDLSFAVSSPMFRPMIAVLDKMKPPHSFQWDQGCFIQITKKTNKPTSKGSYILCVSQNIEKCDNVIIELYSSISFQKHYLH